MVIVTCVIEGLSLIMAVLTFESKEVTSTVHPEMLDATADDVLMTKAGRVTAFAVNMTDNVAEIFLQTPGAKAIAGVFALASIIVTCIQVRSVEYHSFLHFWNWNV